MRSRPDHDVVVVGAGPTGLLLAGDVARAGLRVTVLEKRAEGSTLSRAFAVHARTLEHLDTRGLADDLVATGHRVDELRLFGALSIRLTGLPSRFPYTLITPQHHVERLLEERAAGAGVTVHRRAEVTGLDQDDDGVTVTYEGPGGTQYLTAHVVVGADGHHSTVRGQLGLDFPGRSVVRSVMLADVRMSAPPADLLTVAGNRAGFCFVVPFGDGWYRVVARDAAADLADLADDAPLHLEDLRRTCRRVLGTDHGLHSPRWLSRFHSDERQVERYHLGRVFLVGDAAHVHSPAGGMGMNTGLQDAANLGWKLAAVLTNRGGPELLETYDTERRPVGATVVRTSGGLIRAALLRSPIARGLRDAVARGALTLPPVSRRAALMISGIGIRYPAPPGGPDLVGRRAPDLLDGEGRRLLSSTTEGRFTLVAPAFLARRYAGQPWVDTFTPGLPTRPMLVRPDGHVAWTGPAGELARALHGWGPLPPRGPQALRHPPPSPLRHVTGVRSRG